MNPQELLNYFDRISEAPDAIPRLRQFILDLAVRGKLVEQDPDDEPASELLKRIEEERQKLVKDGRIKRQKIQPPIVDSELPFKIPNSWEWVRLGNLCFVITDGAHHTPNYIDDGVPFLSVKDVSSGRISFRDTKMISREQHEVLSKRCNPEFGDILLTKVGTTGIAVLIDNDREFSIFVSLALLKFSQTNIDGKFLTLLINSPIVKKQSEDNTQGIGNKNLVLRLINLFHLPIPPLAEQHRIVAKVDELMTLCDKLETARKEREDRLDRLVQATLFKVSNSEGSIEDTRFFLDNIPHITTRPEHIKQLRQTILDLAVRGKLVEQYPNDEPASELLKRIQVEKNNLIINKEIKKENIIRPDINTDELFNIPKNWHWGYLGDIAQSFRYGTSIKCSYEIVGEPVLRIPNIEKGRIDLDDLKFGPLSVKEADDLRLRIGDILMVRSNGSLNLVGRPALVESHAVGYCYAGYLVRVRSNVNLVDCNYLVLCLNSVHVRDQIEKPIRTTVGLKNVNATELGRLTIPLPPLAEQQRIVAKVDELMALCDKLETRLNHLQTDNQRLLQAILQRAPS